MTNIVPMTQEELSALKARRGEELKENLWWKLSGEEAARAYAAGLRDFSYANLYTANLSYADLSYADLSYADLSYANLYNADLSYADLSNADLSYANLSYADLSNANLYNADLSNANLYNANLPPHIFVAQVWLPGMSSRNDYLRAYADDNGDLRIVAGCFNGTVAEFRQQVLVEKGKESLYLDALKPILKSHKMWKAAQPAKESALEAVGEGA